MLLYDSLRDNLENDQCQSFCFALNHLSWRAQPATALQIWILQVKYWNTVNIKLQI